MAEVVKNAEQPQSAEVIRTQGKSRYKKLAFYLATFSNLPLTQFTQSYPHGFFVERSDRLFNDNVLFQFFTDVIENQYILEHPDYGTMNTTMLDATVIELRKKRTDKNSDRITIGRSPESDIILYNRLVSKNHASVHRCTSCDSIYLFDSGSTNGTFLNDNMIMPHEKYQMADGDTISLGPETKVIYFSPKSFRNFLLGLRSADSK